MHSLYTLRGAKFRDGLKCSSTCQRRSTCSVPRWRSSLPPTTVTLGPRALWRLPCQPARLLPLHPRPDAADGNQGMTPARDRGADMPESRDWVWPNRGHYRSLYHNARAQYGLYLCWFAGVPANLHSLPLTEPGKRYVESTPMKLGDAANVPTRSKPEDRRGRERRTGELGQRSNPDVRAS